MRRRPASLLAAALALAALSVPAAAATKQKTEMATLGAVRAELSYSKKTGPSIFDFRDVRLKVFRNDRQVRDDAYDPGCKEFCRAPAGAPADAESVFVRDLDADGEPEVQLDLYTGGAHCCYQSYIYLYNAAGNTYSRLRQDWGDPGYQFKDLNGDGKTEFETRDDRFAYRFTCYVCSILPVMILRLEGGKLIDVTRQFPDLIRKDAKRNLALYRRERKSKPRDVRGIVAAYVADEYLLGKGAAGLRFLDKAYRRGDFDPPGYGSPTGRKYVRDLKLFLKKAGYST